VLLGAGALALFVAVVLDTGGGRTRAQGRLRQHAKLLETRTGPDVTTAVIDEDKALTLLIDGFAASWTADNANYMEWMGRLPMMLHPQPDHALVICFGVGLTAHSVRDEGPKTLDVVDVNEAVFELAHWFESSNHAVLKDPRVRPTIMDGRAFLRRTSKRFDVVTLEPMPPNFAGVNALYSAEFYELIAARLNEGGIAAQWLPYHLTLPEHSVAIAAAFRESFEDSILWVDPIAGTGVIVGRKKGAAEPLASSWPGLSRPVPGRTLDPDTIRAGAWLGPEAFERYAELGPPVTDDNQLLSYGLAGPEKHRIWADIVRANLDLVRRVRNSTAPR
jgi:spermidine synthase